MGTTTHRTARAMGNRRRTALHVRGRRARPAAAGAPPLPDIQALGPQVGAKVPEFSLPDQTGTVRTLQSLMGTKGLMLLFYRSADCVPVSQNPAVAHFRHGCLS